jgi:16S rRNA (cytosine1402-N4)-methyltransferase
MGDELARLKVSQVGGVLLDLGVSSYQLIAGERGFSFQRNTPLDMRMDRNQQRSALDVVNGYDEAALASILYRYGEERASRRIARAIVRRRPMVTTGDLSDAVESAVGGRFLVKTLARVFQALRIEVNDELENLATGLDQALQVLRFGGRLVVISYHSLEDRTVKDFFRREAASQIRSGHKLVPDKRREPRLHILTAHPIKPADREVAANPRARSAKLRAAEKCVP